MHLQPSAALLLADRRNESERLQRKYTARFKWEVVKRGGQGEVHMILLVLLLMRISGSCALSVVFSHL
jgi:hypothetical protein